MKVYPTVNGCWCWKIEHEGSLYGDFIKPQEGKPPLTEERVRDIAERKWAKDLALLEKFKTL